MARQINHLFTNGDDCIAVVVFEGGGYSLYEPRYLEFRIIHFKGEDALDFFWSKRFRRNKKFSELYSHCIYFPTLTINRGEVQKAANACYKKADEIASGYPYMTDFEDVELIFKEYEFVSCIERAKKMRAKRQRKDEERQIRAAVTPETEASPLPRRARL